MSLFLHKRDDSDRYKVNVVSDDNKKVDSGTSKKSHGYVRRVANKALSFLMSLLFVGVALLGAIGTAAPAQAGNFIEDGFKSAFCSAGMFNYELSLRGMNATTGDETSDGAITPYEKFGTAGLQYTVWLGPESGNGLEDEGKFGGVSIINFSGGKDASQIEKWGEGEKADDGKSTTKYPGFYNTAQTCNPLAEVGGAAVANMLLATAGDVVNITNLIYQTASESSSNILSYLDGTITDIVQSLKDAVYFEFLTLMITISALWMAWVGLVKKASTQMAQGAIWMIGACVASVFLMTNPMWLPKISNDVVSQISEAGMNAVTSVTTAKSTDGTENMCKAATTGKSAPTKGDPSALFKFSAPDTKNPNAATTRRMVRQMQCTMWYSFLYTPWMIGEFGVSPANISDDSPVLHDWEIATQGQNVNNLPQIDKKAAHVQLGTYQPAGKNQNWAFFHLDNKIKYPSGNADSYANQQRALLNVAMSQLHTDKPNAAYKGFNPEVRMSNALLALLSSLGAGLMIVVVSISMIILDLGLIILTLVSPLFFLVGVHPGFGRRIALGWLETIAGLTIKRIVLSLILSVLLVFYSSVLDASDKTGMPWLVSMIMVIAVSVGGIMYKDKILSMFNKISFGGNGGFDGADDPNSRRMKQAMKRGAMRAAGMGTGDLTPNKMRKILGESNKRGESSNGSGAGGTPNARQTERDEAAAQVHERNNADGAGGEPHQDTDAPQVDERNGEGAGGEPRNDSNDDSQTDERNGEGAGGEPRNGEESEEDYDSSGAGGEPQHYRDAQGNVVDENGQPVEGYENAATPDERGQEPAPETSQALENLRAQREGREPRQVAGSVPEVSPSSRALDNLRGQREGGDPYAVPVGSANASRALPPLPVKAGDMKDAAKMNRAIDKEQKRLGGSATRNEAMASLQAKEAAAERARQTRQANRDRLVQKKREVFNEPMRELKTMASSADSAFGNPVKKTVQKAGAAGTKAGNSITAHSAKRWDERQARNKFEKDVTAQVKANRQQSRTDSKNEKERMRSIPKEYRETIQRNNRK